MRRSHFHSNKSFCSALVLSLFANPAFAVVDTYLKCSVTSNHTVKFIDNTEYLLSQGSVATLFFNHVGYDGCFPASVLLEGGPRIAACETFGARSDENALLDTLVRQDGTVTWAHYPRGVMDEPIQIEFSCNPTSGLY